MPKKAQFTFLRCVVFTGTAQGSLPCLPGLKAQKERNLHPCRLPPDVKVTTNDACKSFPPDACKSKKVQKDQHGVKETSNL